jgi:hypothetical protein
MKLGYSPLVYHERTEQNLKGFIGKFQFELDSDITFLSLMNLYTVVCGLLREDSRFKTRMHKKSIFFSREDLTNFVPETHIMYFIRRC